MTKNAIVAFAYDSDDDIPIAAADPIYSLGENIVGSISHPGKKNWIREKYWYQNNANLAGTIKKGYQAPSLSIELYVWDAIPFYCGLGKVTADSPDTDQFLIQGSVDGDVPQMISHVETNLKLAEEQAMEFLSKCQRMEIKCIDGFLGVSLEFIGGRIYYMGDGAIKSTTDPTPRGTIAGAISVSDYRYPMQNNANLTCTWNSLNLGGYMMPTLSSEIMNPIVAEHVDDGNDYPHIRKKGHREYGNVEMSFFVGGDVDDLVADCDGSTSSDLVLKIPRRHSNDYIQITWKSAELKNVIPALAWKSGDSPPLINAVFEAVEDIEIIDRQVTAAGVAAPNADADYEL